MRAESCKDCPHFSNGSDCVRLGKPISKVRGCSLCAGGKKFFRARHGKEAFRLNVLGKHKKGEKE